MARRRREDDTDHPDRWLVSYADFVTLLMAFFVVMYAISSVNEGRYKVVSESLVKAFQANQAGKGQSGEVAPHAGMQAMADDINQVLEPLVRDGRVRVTQSARGLAVEINASVLFEPGQAELQPESAGVLASVAKVLARSSNGLEVEGHTDDSPIASPIYPSNWELSSARASRVVRLFRSAGVAPARMAAVGYGEYRNVETNDTPEGRTRNRRVTVVILPLEPVGGVAGP
jgi:chemotaxis protein MotB